MPILLEKNIYEILENSIFSLTYRGKTHIIMRHMLLCIKKYSILEV